MGTKRLKQILVGCFVIGALLLGFVIEAKAETLATSADEIVGTWVSNSCWAGTCYLRFYKDGTTHEASALDKLDGEPYAINSYQLKGTEMFVKEVKVVGVPSSGDVIGRYQVELLESGNIRIVCIEDPWPRGAAFPGEFKPVR